jgi:membrane-bound lytic murein transglycosylase D
MNFRISLFTVLLLFILSSCAQLSQNGNLSRNRDIQSSESSDLNSTDLEKDRISPGTTSPVLHVTPQRGNIDGVTAKIDESFHGNRQEAGENLYPAKKAQTVLDDALELCQVSQEFWQKGELENAVDALDQAYALILGVDATDQPKLIQQKEDLRFMISKRILEIYASRNIVVNGNHDAIPLVMNNHVQAEIKRFTIGSERKFFKQAYQRSGRYRPQIVAALREAGLPEELSWLPLIESGFKVNALSRSRALGLWQFIPSTGYKFGLKRDKFIDERMDPVKSTTAAIGYLKELHGIFGDWSTVLAAYNCGEGRVLRVCPQVSRHPSRHQKF